MNIVPAGNAVHLWCVSIERSSYNLTQRALNAFSHLILALSVFRGCLHAVNVEVIISWDGCGTCKEIISRKSANLLCHPALSLGVQTYVAGPVWRTGHPYSRLQGPSEGQGVPPREIREEEVVRLRFLSWWQCNNTVKSSCWVSRIYGTFTTSNG